MAANPQLAAAWNAIPLTKFRAPRLRRDVVARPALLERLHNSIENCPVTLVCAPGGSGKTTLLTQWATQPREGVTLSWVSIDEDDNDRQRFFATLLHAVEPMNPVWEMPTATLLTNAAGSDSQCRAALAVFVNALCTIPARRIVIVLDDLHRADRTDVFGLLEALIERLPDHVALVLGSRVEPALPLARWRAHGELAEFIPWDLQFSEADAIAFAAARLGIAPDPTSIREALRRTHGWAVGLTMVLQAQLRGATTSPRRSLATDPADSSDRHLFAYLAQEILAELPSDLRKFVLEVSVLAELCPSLCEAVTGRADSQELLETLYRRNLFVTATDDSVPVLRFHDLFREFLQQELEQRDPQRAIELHERAGRAEPSLAHAIGHFVRAQRWDEAIRLIAANGEAMLGEGGHAALERWIDQIPEEARHRDSQDGAKIAYLRGICAWLRWDWPRTRRELQPAIAGLNTPQQMPLRIRAMFLQVDAYNSSGEGALAWQMLDEIAAQPLDEVSNAHLALQRAWCVLPNGNPEAVRRYMNEFLVHVEREPASVCPQTADRIHCLCIGLPGIADVFERYFSQSEVIRGNTSAPWQLAALAAGAWAQFWRGRREPVQRMLERGATLHREFGEMRLVAERMLQFKALYLAASGQYEASGALMKMLIAALQTPEASAHRAVWLRAYQQGLARLYWISGDHDSFRALAPTLLSPRLATEWPFMDTAIELVRGQVAMLREDWRTAEAALEQAVRTHERFRMPMNYGDPRINLAYMHLLRGNRERSWQAFEPALKEVLEQQAAGLLLLEPKHVTSALLEVAPADLRRSAEFESLAARLALWDIASVEPSIAADATGPLAVLSDREQDVLARVASGASNKHIARDLALSLHTVKRHIANILDKLDCTSRGQAADLYRKARPG